MTSTVHYALASLVALGAFAITRSASAEIVGVVDVIDRRVQGWALDKASNTSLDVAVWLSPIDANGNVGAPQQALSRTVKADQSRPDLAGFGQGTLHGFNSSLEFLPEGAYEINPIAIDPNNANNKTSLGVFRVVRRISDAPRTDFWLQYKGVVPGLARNNDYESYPTVMNEGGTYRMWFCGGPGDKIFYATSAKPYEGWTVQNSYNPVLGESPSGLDNGLVCDPSVVRAPGSPYYFMQYTAVAKAGAEFSLNRAFTAISSDGVSWAKMDGRTKTLTDSPWPILWSSKESASPTDPASTYGTGQTSVIFDSLAFAGGAGTGFISYFTDTAVAGLGVATSTDGSWNFTKHVNALPKQPGEYTWDFKRHQGTGRTVGMVAKFGDYKAGSTVVRAGAIGITVSSDGLNFTDSGKMNVPMVQLTTDDQHQCINNGGLVGNEYGVITGDESAFYFGAGWGTNFDPNFLGVWPALRWDIAAVDVKIHDCGPGTADNPCGTPAVLVPGSDGGVATGEDGGDGNGYALLDGGSYGTGGGGSDGTGGTAGSGGKGGAGSNDSGADAGDDDSSGCALGQRGSSGRTSLLGILAIGVAFVGLRKRSVSRS